MIQLNAQRIRFACDTSKPFSSAIDAITGAAITLPSGSALQFELLFYFQALADATLLDLTVYSNIVVQLQDNIDPHNGTIFFTGSINAANFGAATAAGWTAGTAQHLLLNIPAAQNIVPPATTSYWVCIYATSTNAAQDLILLAAANITGRDSGVPQGVPTLPQTFKAGTKISFVCSDGLTRDVQYRQLGNGRWSLDISQAGYNGVGQAVMALYCSDGQFRDLTVQNVQGVWTLDISQNGHS